MKLIWIAAAAVLFSGNAFGARAAESPPAGQHITPQQALDLLASFPIPSSEKKPGAPFVPLGPFSAWTSEQQTEVPQTLSRGCQLLWGMYHDDDATRFLPAASLNSDEEALGIDICLAGHMPHDWPDWGAHVKSAEEIFARAKQAGSTLQLPSQIRR